MITYTHGNIFKSHANAIVNPVNTVGVMGKGLAKQFRERYPQMYNYYKLMCDIGAFNVGEILWYQIKDDENVAMLPTKKDWRDPSKLAYVEDGLAALADDCKLYNVTSLAIPKLGCGLGGLNWDDVKPLIEKYFGNASIEVEVYE